MSDLRVNTIGNLSGATSYTTQEVADLININSTAWNGVNITQAEVEALGATVQGTGFTAKKYPDNSIVGSTSNGNFEMRPNGELTQLMDDPISYTTTVVVGSMYFVTTSEINVPIVFNGIFNYLVSARSIGGTGVFSTGEVVTKLATSVSSRMVATSSNKIILVSYCGYGRWKP